MTQKLNRGDKVIVMNGYQCYLKRMQHVIPMEVLAARHLGYNLGVKLIRGAYMNEERSVAKSAGVESPVHETIEDTHACYNENLSHVIESMNAQDLILCASHNVESVEIAKDLLNERQLPKDRVRFGQLKGFSD